MWVARRGDYERKNVQLLGEAVFREQDGTRSVLEHVEASARLAWDVGILNETQRPIQTTHC